MTRNLRPEPGQGMKQALTRLSLRLFDRLVPPIDPLSDQLDILFGSRAIARFLGIPNTEVRTLIRNEALPVFKLGGTDCARRSVLSRTRKTMEARHGDSQ